MSFGSFDSFHTGIPTVDDVQGRLDNQAALLTHAIGGLYEPLDSAMTYQAAQLAGPVKALKSAATRAVNGQAKLLTPIGDTLDTVVANHIGEQAGSLANAQAALAAYSVTNPVNSGSHLGPSPSVSMFTYRILYDCTPPGRTEIATVVGGNVLNAQIPPQVRQTLNIPDFATAAQAASYLANGGQAQIDANCKPSSVTQPPIVPTPTPTPIPPVNIIGNPEPMPACADPSWITGPINTIGQYPVSPPVFHNNQWDYYYGGPYTTGTGGYLFIELPLPGGTLGPSYAVLPLCTPIVVPLPPSPGIWGVYYTCSPAFDAVVAYEPDGTVTTNPPPPTGYTVWPLVEFPTQAEAAAWLLANYADVKDKACNVVTPPPPPPPEPCCPDWDALIAKLCKCLHTINLKEDPVDLDQPLAFLFGEQRAKWHPKAIAFYGPGLADIVGSQTLQQLRDLRESAEG